MTDTITTPASSGQAPTETKPTPGHTPGHWEHDGNGLIYSDFVRDEGGTATLICDVADDLNAACCGITPEQEANARLIAAAPNMLEALVAMKDAGYLYGAYQPTLDMVDAAIAGRDRRGGGMTGTTNLTQLPPDPDGQNDDRAGWADLALLAFQAATGTDREDALSDLLCDLMHLCDRDIFLGSFETQVERARGHYEAETGGEDAA